MFKDLVLFFLKFFCVLTLKIYFVFNSVCVWICAHTCSTHGGQRRATGPLLEWQAVVSSLWWVLEAKLWSLQEQYTCVISEPSLATWVLTFEELSTSCYVFIPGVRSCLWLNGAPWPVPSGLTLHCGSVDSVIVYNGLCSSVSPSLLMVSVVSCLCEDEMTFLNEV